MVVWKSVFLLIMLFFFIVKAIVEQAIIIFKDRFVLNQVLNVINVIDFY